MKKLLILTATLLTGGLALPAAAQYRSHYQSQQTEVYISGYLPCGSPIYSRRTVSHGHHNRAYYKQQARIQRERENRRRHEIQDEIERQHYLASRRNRGRSYQYQPHCR